MKQQHILIIGGGPAGATTSLFLSKFGIPHTLVDSAAFPRDKVCGDGLDLKVVRVLHELRPELILDVLPNHPHFRPMQGVRFFSPSGRSSSFLYQPEPDQLNVPLFYTSKRKHFDAFLIALLDKNYCDFRAETSVEKIYRRDTGWEVHCQNGEKSITLQPDFIIAADGDHSVMLRHLRQREIEKKHYAATLRQYWSNVAGTGNAIEVYTPPDLPMSYFYMFPLPNHEVNVGYGMTSSLVAKHKYNLRDLFQQLISTDPVLAPRFAQAKPLEKPKGWGLPLASLKRKSWGSGYVLVGDAASMVGPTSGEGIGTGMMSGLVAARFVHSALKRGDLTDQHFRHFDREVYRRLQVEIKLYRTVMWWQPWFLWNKALDCAHLPLVHQRFQREVHKWINTAYRTPIDVNVD